MLPPQKRAIVGAGNLGFARQPSGAVILNRGSEREAELPSKFPYRKSAAGERLCLIGPCGGGYGDPAERDPAAVREDVLDGYVSEDSTRTAHAERPAS